MFFSFGSIFIKGLYDLEVIAIDGSINVYLWVIFIQFYSLRVLDTQHFYTGIINIHFVY